jgi:hypothetical protein
LFLAFYQAGKKSWFLFAAVISCFILGREANFLFWFVGMAIYLASWVYIHNVVKRYHKAYELELKAAPMAT